MAKVVGDVVVTVGADTSDFDRGMKAAQRSLGSFNERAAGIAKNMAKVGVAVAAVSAAAVAGGYRIAQSAAATAREIQNLSNLAGVSAESFQRYAAAAEKVGIGQEKLGDIFKDVNDKFGDFMANGAGPLKDFFENIAPKVGVTADQFARLSGPDALQLYVTSLEAAGVSQQQMTFYMEALASDATALIPLLRNGGSEMKRFGDEAERSGRILSNDMVRGGADLDRKMSDLASTIRQQFTAAILDNADEIANLVDVFTTTFIPALIGVGEFVGSVAIKVGEFAGAISDAAENVGSFYDTVSKFAKDSGLTAHAIWGDDEGKWPAWLRALRGDVPANDRTDSPTELIRSGDGPTFGPSDAIYGMTTGQGLTLNRPLLPPGSGPKKKKRRGGGGRNLADDFEQMQQALMTQAEQVDLWREEQLAKLREFREAKIATEEEFNELERQINSEHQEAMAEINRRAMDAKLQAVGGAFGDLASLMQSENAKLFKIGKAAALAEAVVHGYSAAVAAWEKGMKVGGPPVAAAFTAASIARTGALISSISSASPSGGGGGFGGGTAAAAAAPQPLNVYMPQIRPEAMYSGATVTSLFDALQKEAGDRGLNVVFPA